MTKPRIGVTMGDPAGVGPEICLDLLADSSIADRCTPIVFGDAEVLRLCAERTGKASSFQMIYKENLTTTDSPSVLDLGLMDLEQLKPGACNPATGKATYGYVTEAVDACLSSQVDAVATSPANKEAMQSAGISQLGHTEIFAERTQTEKFCMAFICETISCSLVTVHAGYAEVPDLISEQRIAEVIELTREVHQKLLGKEPRIAVCGLNPHAGENGLFGNSEEEKIILPAIQKMRNKGCDLTGPLPPTPLSPNPGDGKSTPTSACTTTRLSSPSRPLPSTKRSTSPSDSQSYGPRLIMARPWTLPGKARRMQAA